jgi:hypothetical protein
MNIIRWVIASFAVGALLSCNSPGDATEPFTLRIVNKSDSLVTVRAQNLNPDHGFSAILTSQPNTSVDHNLEARVGAIVLDMPDTPAVWIFTSDSLSVRGLIFDWLNDHEFVIADH